MAYNTLQRRKTQLALLADACDRQVPAEVHLRRGYSQVGRLRFCRVEQDSLLLAWIDAPVVEVQVPGQPLQVSFEHRGQRYTFSATGRGSDRAGQDRAMAERHLWISLPLSIGRPRRRAEPRTSLDGLPPIPVEFTHVVDDRRHFTGRLANAGPGGLAAIASAADVGTVYSGDLFWCELRPPSSSKRYEFVVRLVHLRPANLPGEVQLGWELQPGDGESLYPRLLNRLEAYARDKQ